MQNVWNFTQHRSVRNEYLQKKYSVKSSIQIAQILSLTGRHEAMINDWRMSILLLGAILCSQTLTTASSITEHWKSRSRGAPVISTYEFQPTRAKGEIWAFCHGDNGQIWIGTDELFLFNGTERKRVNLPPETYAVRALVRDKQGRIWVGSIGEIGYVEQDPTGEWQFYSLKKQLEADGLGNILDIWSAYDTPDGIVFIEAQRIIRWSGKHFESWELSGPNPQFVTSENGNLWIVNSGVGILQMHATGPSLIMEAPTLPDPNVLWVITYNKNNKESMIIGGVGGIYRLTNGKWHKMPNLSKVTKEKIPAHVARLDDNTIAIGTYRGGLIIATLEDEILSIIDHTSGLPNDSIMSLWFDGLNHLWLGLQEAFVAIEIKGKTSIFGPENNLKYTPALRVLKHGKSTYLLTKVDLAKTEEATQTHLTSVLKPMSLFSDIGSTDDSLWVSESSGIIHEINNHGKVTQHFPDSNYYDFSLLRTSNPNLTFVYTSGTKLGIMQKEPSGRWTKKSSEINIGTYVLSIVQGPDSDIWLSTYTKGIYRYHMDSSSPIPQLQLIRHFVPGEDFSSDLNQQRLTVVGENLFSLSESAICEYSPEKDSFIPCDNLQDLGAIAATRGKESNTAYWAVTSGFVENPEDHHQSILELKTDNGSRTIHWSQLNIPGLEQIGRISSIDYTEEDDGILWISGNRSTLRVNLNSIDAVGNPPSVELAGVFKNSTRQVLPAKNEPFLFPADAKTIEFEFSGIRRAITEDLRIQTRIVGITENWTEPTTNENFQITGLRHGKYQLQAKSVDNNGRTGPILSVDFRIKAPWYLTSFAIVLYVGLGVFTVVGIIKWKLHQVRKQNRYLNQLVHDRTRELVKASAAKNEFIESMSHEIRNPLNGISNLVDLITDAELPPKIQQLAESLERSTSHLKEVFNEVLGYALLEYGHIVSSNTVFSVEELLQDILLLFEGQSREAGTKLSLDLPLDLHDKYYGDVEKIRTIVSNFVGNAIKYAPGSPVILSTKPLAQKSPRMHSIRFEVKDGGSGISPEDKDVLFQKFSRGESVKKQKIPGTGLGLATCKALADLLQAKVGFQNNPEKGATFWLELELQPSRASSPSQAESTHIKTKGNALIVDDQDYNQVVLMGIAGSLGYRCEGASLAAEVWPLIEKKKFDAVFLDWELPDLNGDEIAKQLRKHPSTKEAVIIATTAHSSEKVRQKCMEAGMDGFALKPFNKEQLRSIILKAQSRREGRALRLPGNALQQTKPQIQNKELSLQVFHDFAEGDPTRADQAISLYLSNLNEELRTLKAHIEASNAKKIASQAHRIRSHAALVNACHLNESANRLVMAARKQTADDWKDCYSQVFEEAEKLKKSIKEAKFTF